jgi:hypothetical protein
MLTDAPDERAALSDAGRILLATLSGAAGVIHLVMAPDHYGESAVEGIGFLIAGWIQIAIAVLVVVRPSWALLRFTIGVNLVLAATWVISRVFGLPFGEHAWHAETVSSVDLTCVLVEVGLIAVCGALLARPTLGKDWDASKLVLSSIVPLGVVVLVSGVLVSPGARNHAHGSHGEHAAGGADHADGHGHAEGAEDDLGLAALQNGHQHDTGIEEIDDETQTALSAQLNQTRVLVDKYPTVAAAEAAGYFRAGPFSPGLGAHYVGFRAEDKLVSGDETLTPTIIYDGIEPDSPIAGFMYQTSGADEPKGFVGPNDHWHYHTNTCIVFKNGRIEAPLGADDEDVTQADCDAVDGNLIENTGYMVHVWTVPGYESPRGVFSEVNPALTCPDGTYYTKPEGSDPFAESNCLREAGGSTGNAAG